MLAVADVHVLGTVVKALTGKNGNKKEAKTTVYDTNWDVM